MKHFAAWLIRYDHTLIEWVNCQWKCRLLDWLMPRFTHLGGATATIGFLLLWLMFAPDSVKWWSVEGLAALGGSHLAVRGIKAWKPRLRPYLRLGNLHTFPNPLTDWSFPSGHTTAAFSVAVTFFLHVPDTGIVLLPYAVTVGLSRIYLALHYPTDVLIGGCLGSGFAVMFAWMFERFLT